MTRRCIRAVFAAFLLISVFNAGRLENVTKSLVDDQWLNVADAELVTSQLSATEDVDAVEADSWNLLERVRVFSTMTTSYNWSARFDDRDRDKTLTVVFSYSYIAGYYSDTTNVKQAGGYVTAAIEDFCRRPGNNRLKDYYFEYILLT